MLEIFAQLPPLLQAFIGCEALAAAGCAGLLFAGALARPVLEQATGRPAPAVLDDCFGSLAD